MALDCRSRRGAAALSMAAAGGEPRAPVAVRIVELDTPGDLDLTREQEPYRGALLIGLRNGAPVGTASTSLAGRALLPAATIAALFADAAPGRGAELAPPAPLPTVSVVVTTCAQEQSTAEAVASVLACEPAPLEVIVVENRPARSRVAAMLRERFPADGRVRCVEEPHVGLSSARNAGLWAAEGDVVAFTDDDVIVDHRWIGRIARAFAEEPDAACVTGLIVPGDLNTPTQLLMEQFAGFGKGFERRVHRLSAPSSPLAPFAAGEFGSGACTALRREAGRALGGFDPALGAGTASRGGEDLDLFVRVLLAGHAIVYEPAAMLSHRHPDEDRRLRNEIFSYGVGLVAMITKQALDGQALAIARRIPLALRHLRDPASRKNVRKAPEYPRSFDWIERAGMVVGPFAYLRSRRHERRLAAASATGPATAAPGR
ncbi:MAG TPA: glycosyltransferase [Solirubrobacteraceae bacterium]|nr:glycosyltransferase [Solirubrobacteraceae bacterium]